MTGATYICGGDSGTAAKRHNDCPDALHDWPLPSGYVDASDEAGWRLNNRWSNVKCPACGLYGWTPGRTTEAHVKRPAQPEQVQS